MYFRDTSRNTVDNAPNLTLSWCHLDTNVPSVSDTDRIYNDFSIDQQSRIAYVFYPHSFGESTLYLVFIEDTADSVEALRILLDRRKLQSTVVFNGRDAIEVCNNRRKGSCIIANPHCLKSEIGSFLQSAARSNLQVIVHDHLNTTFSQPDYPSNVAQVIPKSATPEIACAQIVLTVRQLTGQRLLEKRHDAVSVTLGLEKDLSKVINVYSTILDLGYDKVASLIRDYARRSRITIAYIVDEHRALLDALNDDNYAESIKDCEIEAPILRELTMGSRLTGKKRNRGG